MPPIDKTFAVELTIPDNEAFTALETLQRLGIAAAAVRRATIWTFTVDAPAAATLASTVATLEPIFNANKHALVERDASLPELGEVWIAPLAETLSDRVGGQTIPGVRAVGRCTAWRLLDASGNDVEPAVLDRAVETFLCNPAFQKAIR